MSEVFVDTVELVGDREGGNAYVIHQNGESIVAISIDYITSFLGQYADQTNALLSAMSRQGLSVLTEPNITDDQLLNHISSQIGGRVQGYNIAKGQLESLARHVSETVQQAVEESGVDE